MLLDIRDMTTIADYFVISTATSTVQMRAVVDFAAEQAEKAFGVRGRIEGEPGDGWMVVDFRDVLMHVFLPEQRNYYRLEELWAEARALVQMV